jgi:hypothetical protein
MNSRVIDGHSSPAYFWRANLCAPQLAYASRETMMTGRVAGFEPRHTRPFTIRMRDCQTRCATRARSSTSSEAPWERWTERKEPSRTIRSITSGDLRPARAQIWPAGGANISSLGGTRAAHRVARRLEDGTATPCDGDVAAGNKHRPFRRRRCVQARFLSSPALRATFPSDTGKLNRRQH